MLFRFLPQGGLRVAGSGVLSRRSVLGVASAAAVALSGVFGAVPASAQTALLNVSYDPTRELYRQINELFQAHWKKETGEDIVVRTSHGGSGGQANKVIEGLEADVVTLGIASDIDLIARETPLIPKDWREKLPNNGLPYTSTVVFVVRKGNPKNIVNWGDLVRDDVKIITPNPKTSAGGRWNFLTAWGYALDQNGNDDAKAQAFVTQFYKNVPVLDPGARGSTISFAQRDLGDVLPAWENEAHLILKEFGTEKFDIVVPPFSISAEPPVALVVGNVDKRGTRKQAEAYLNFLYTPEAQTVIAQNWYRPSRPETVTGEVPKFEQLKLFRAEDKFGDWATIQKRFFGDGSVFDEISKAVAQR